MKTRQKPKALVKLYSWNDLTALVVRDLRKQYGIPINDKAEFHYMGGVDERGNPFIRIDLTPMHGVAKFKP